MKTIEFVYNGVYADYKVTYKPIINNQINKLPQEVQNQIGDLFITCQKDPQQSIPKIKKLLTRYPFIPQLFNFLTTAYSLLGEYDMAEKYALKCCQNHPEYLFAKINYAEIYQYKKEYHKIPPIFDNQPNLQLLYPSRNEFHLTEVVGFTSIWCTYFFETGDRLVAEEYYQIIKKLCPESPVAKRLQKMINK